jgi:formylglycine-generating enzyme required for sulfatase activity
MIKQSTIIEPAAPTNLHPHHFPPPWAGSWGDDRFGLWAQFELVVDKQTVQQRMRWIAPGDFLMGSPETELGRSSNEGPQHRVVISQGFWLADTACSQALWQILMKKNPSQFKKRAGGGLLDHPVESVSWHDVQVFLRQLQAVLRNCVASLPTEAEWEYACRAGSLTSFGFGGNINTDQANFNGNYPYGDVPKGQNRAHPVAVKALPPNGWGLYQMHGNVWEWCVDAPREYGEAEVVEPGLVSALAQAQTLVVDDKEIVYALRGGGWFNGAQYARSASRNDSRPGRQGDVVGFRFALRSACQVGQRG